MRAKHQSDSRVLPPNVCFSFPQLNVRVPELQDSCTVDSTTEQREGQRVEIITHPALCPTQGSVANRAMKQKEDKYASSLLRDAKLTLFNFLDHTE